MKFFSAVFILSLVFSTAVIADKSLEEEMNNALLKLLPDVQINGISETPIDGLYQVIIGPDVIYMSRDGKYVIKGDLLDIDARRNMTEDVRSNARAELISKIPERDYIEFAPDKVTDTIYVFTDVDCGYCRKLHQDVPELNARGIGVRYLAYPRAGVDSMTGREMSSVWCAADRQEALTASKNREPIEQKKCNDPVAKQYELGKQLGVRGTPAIFLGNGRTLPGYMPPNEIVQQLRR
ncbi:MAG: DsbC family protein [Proteobacteria bacterium]|nr:DsbC family protein [Pseudomonadota bacterium]